MLAPFHDNFPTRGTAMSVDANKKVRQVLLFMIPGFISKGYLITYVEVQELFEIELLRDQQVVDYLKSWGHTACMRQGETLEQVFGRIASIFQPNKAKGQESACFLSLCRSFEGARAS